MYLTANHAFHSRTKYFELDHPYVIERVALGSLVVKHIPSHQQLADIFTKYLPLNAFTTLLFKLGVDVPSTPSLKGVIRAKRLTGAEALPVLERKTKQYQNETFWLSDPTTSRK